MKIRDISKIKNEMHNYHWFNLKISMKCKNNVYKSVYWKNVKNMNIMKLTQ